MTVSWNHSPRNAVVRIGRVEFVGLALALTLSACAHGKVSFHYDYLPSHPGAASPRIALLTVKDERTDKNMDAAFTTDFMSEVRKVAETELLSTGLFSAVRSAEESGGDSSDGESERWRIELSITRANFETVNANGDWKSVVMVDDPATGVIALLLGGFIADQVTMVDTYSRTRFHAIVSDARSNRPYFQNEYVGVATEHQSLAQAHDPDQLSTLLGNSIGIAMGKLKVELEETANQAK